MKKTIILSSIVASFALVGCGGSSTSSDTTAYLVDSAVANVDYDCIADGDYNKTTAKDGAFTCRDMAKVRFRLGELVLGEIDSVPADHYVFPQDLLHVARDSSISDENVTAMAQLLQSLDSDQDPTNGITINNDIKKVFENGTFDANYLVDYVNEAGVTLVDQVTAQNHLRETLRNHANGKGGHNDQNGSLVDLSNYPLSTLTDELKNAMAHMGNEERLAYDVYMNLYNYHQENSDTSIYQLYNIAQNSEKRHIATVQALVRRYDLNSSDIDVVDDNVTADNNMSNDVTLDDMPSGVYDIPEIQALYDDLYAKGVNSKQDALEVGCMVEVTDINDLDGYIALAQDSNADDAEAVFTALRKGSYNHYWAFDKGLKNIGVDDGCCSLGDEWCHPEYPQK
jgi:hypothetical protein